MASDTATCIAFRFDGEICGRTTEDNSDYCFIHRDIDPWRGVKDIGAYLKGGAEFAMKAKEAVAFIGVLLAVVGQHALTPMAQNALDELERAGEDAGLLLSQLNDEAGKSHSQDDAEHMQSRLSFLVDRINTARRQMDEFVPGPAHLKRTERVPDAMA